MELQSEKSAVSTIGICIKTILTAFFITAILMAILALLICYTPLDENFVTGGVYILNYFSVFMAGLISAVKTKKKGFITGGISAVGYMLLVYLLGYILFGGIDFSKGVILNIIYCAVTGMLGGIIGINLSSR